ncbi:MAG: hypothetical protein ACRCUT_13350, partial [Spirochaetota bacterium]
MLKKYAGIIVGAAAGTVDVIPMLWMKLPAESCASAFVMWAVIGFVVSKIDIGVKGALKGMITAVILIQPTAILIAAREPASLFRIGIT